jgi:hypothetical protein
MLRDEQALGTIYGRSWVAMPYSAMFQPGLRVLRASVVSFLSAPQVGAAVLNCHPNTPTAIPTCNLRISCLGHALTTATLPTRLSADEAVTSWLHNSVHK